MKKSLWLTKLKQIPKIILFLHNYGLNESFVVEIENNGALLMNASSLIKLSYRVHMLIEFSDGN